MKITHFHPVSVAVVALALVLTGCASNAPHKKANRASTGMSDAGQGLESLATQTEATLAALNDLVLNPGPDLVSQFRAYENSVKRLTSLSDRAISRTERMRRDAQTYFKEWQAGLLSIANPDIREQSERRRAEVNQAFQEVDNSLRQVKDSYAPFLSDLTDIRRALGNDLTPGGIQAMTSIAEKAMPKGRKLQESLLAAAADVRNLAAKLAPAVPQ